MNVFTEHGVAMLASVLKSKEAARISIYIIKAFIRLRRFMLSHKELSHKLTELEKRIDKRDGEIYAIFEAIRQLMAPPEKPKGQIGFRNYNP